MKSNKPPLGYEAMANLQFLRGVLFTALFVLLPAMSGYSQSELEIQSEKLVLSRSIDRDGLIWMDVQVNDHAAKALFGTGTTINFVNSRNIDWLKPPLDEALSGTVTGAVKVNRHPPCTVRLGDCVLPSPMIGASTDMAHIEKFWGTQLDIVVGCPAIFGRCLELNFSDGVAALSDARIDTSKSIQLENKNSCLFVPELLLGSSRVNGKSFLVDTGSNQSVYVEEKIFQRLIDDDQLKYLESSETTSGKTDFRAQSGRVSEIRMGEFVLRDVLVTSGKSNKIGMGFLRRFDSKIDSKALIAAFQPNRFFDVPDSSGLAGFEMKRADKAIKISKVSKGGPAESAGLVVGDLVLEINTIKTKHNNLHELNRESRGDEGKKLTLLVARNGKELRRNLVLSYRPSNDVLKK